MFSLAPTPRISAAITALAMLTPLASPKPARAREGLHIPAAAEQLIVVSSLTYDPANYLATFRTYERATPRSPWHVVLGPWKAETGYGHLRDSRHEGDGSTPTGVFGIGSTVYGNHANPGGLRYAYHRLTCGDWWDEDPYSNRYNQFVHVACGVLPTFAAGSEALWTETVAYPYFAVIHFNADPTIGGAKAPGSGIFLHSWVNGPTAGCVALREPELLAVLRWLNPRLRPVIEIAVGRELRRSPSP